MLPKQQEASMDIVEFFGHGGADQDIGRYSVDNLKLFKFSDLLVI